ncbi:sugar transferase [Demequina sp. NBRC 110057]|uniref:sugar transferase n=1 Tax=Demequina sp. NBRC 110057 TaxID=1570346 RepID=UPI0009FF6A4A|nr:sugar transferase [Demequina sp. NBRC 110057]
MVHTHRQPMRGETGWAKTYERRLAWTDAFVVTLTMVIAYGVRFGWEPLVPVSGDNAPAYVLVIFVIATVWILLLGWIRSRDAAVLGHGPQEFQRVLQASWLTFAFVAVAGFLTQWQISRGYLLFALPLGTCALVVYRAAWRFFMHAQRDRGELQAQCIVVGPPATAQQMVTRLHAQPRAGYAVIGVCLSGDVLGRRDDLEGITVLGPAAQSAEVAKAAGAEYVILAGTDALSLRETQHLGWQLEGTGIGLVVVPSILDVAGPRVSFSPVQGLPLMHVDAPRFRGGRYVMKETVDRVLAFLFLTVLAIPMGAVAVLVKATSPGPVLFKQERIGRDGQPFWMYKFRSMVPNAESRLEEAMGGEVTVFYKNDADPRVTPFGRFIRRYSIDELPQLVNALKGDMSIVGPRPQVAAEVAQYDDAAYRRLLVRPGITGLWQVSGRSALSYEESIRLDAYYAENWSIAGDVVIIFRTVWAVLAGRGAY